MEEELTQPATQIVIDPRRLGHHNSGLNDNDLTDIFCILHPASMPACIATAKIAEDSPEHTISNTGVEFRVRGGNDNPLNVPTTFDLAARGVVSRDIALRLSADLKDPMMDFCFGRNAQRCDFVIAGTDGAKRISNVHFRIYINEHGVIMLEDQSTNGTQVENVMLRAKEKARGDQYKHTLQQGSLITLVMTPPDEDIRFVVRIPQRDGEYEAIFDHNLHEYRTRKIQLLQAKGAIKPTLATAEERVDGNHEGPPDIFAAITHRAPSFSNSDLGRHTKEWRGGAKYNKTGVAGKGAFATVYVMSRKFDGSLFAAKELEKRRFMKNGILDQKVDMEIKIMSKISHPHIVQFVESVDWEDYLYLIMEYVPFGDLGTVMNRYEKLDEGRVRIMASQLLSALKYLHHLGITHRDVKPDNILIQSRDPFQVKLTDFGLSKMIDHEETFLRTFCGTLLWCAPEVYNEYREYNSGGHRTHRRDKRLPSQPRYGHAVDVWSLGTVLYHALCGTPPYPAKTGTTHQELLSSIMTKPLDIRPLQRAGVSETGIRFIRSMLHVRPEERATIEQLEADSWVGTDRITTSADEDEVDLIHGTDGTILDEEASQLSINENGDNIDDHQTNVADSFSNESGLEAFGGIKSADSISSESFAFLRNPPGTARLFGEVAASALGSSGVIPQDRLNLPVSASVSEDGYQESAPNLLFSSTSMETNSEAALPPRDKEQSNHSQIPATPDPITQSYEMTDSNTAETVIADPSLLGAESMVEQLQMRSPSRRMGLSSVGPQTPEYYDASTSLRRPHDETITLDDARPAAKRVRSSRETDIPVPKTVFWDARNKETWHNDYPDIMLSQYTEVEDFAKAHGQRFVHGERIFDLFVSRHRKTPSAEPEVQTRAQSEPAGTRGLQAIMKRDERKLEDITDVQLPSVKYEDSLAGSIRTNASSAVPVSDVAIKESPSVESNFKLPRRVLARLTATSDSVLPSINLNITESFTSWGRAKSNSIVFPHVQEDRIPKFAFKLALWKEGLSATDGSVEDQDLSFWISTKATRGIHVNNVTVSSHDYKQPESPSKEWGELRHGDEIILWAKESNPTVFVKFRFECFHGVSQATRLLEDDHFSILPLGDVNDELDRYCLQKERELQDARAKMKAEHEEMEKSKDKENKLLLFKSSPVPIN